MAEASEEHGGLSLTERGEAILFGRERIALRRLPERRETPRRAAAASQARRLDGLDEAAAALFERLRLIRSEFARQESVAAFVVFPDRTLIEMAVTRPATLADMRSVQGVGDRKLLRYGAAFLKAIQEPG